MCTDTDKFYKGNIYRARDGKTTLVSTQKTGLNDQNVWVIHSTTNPKYSKGQWFRGSMGHALPCKNPRGFTESERECRLHQLDAVSYSGDDLSWNDVDKLVLSDADKLVPNLAIDDMVSLNAPVKAVEVKKPVASVAAPTAKKLSVAVVRDPQAKPSTSNAKVSAKVKKVVASTGWKSQKRDSSGRFLSKSKVVAGQKRDRNGRFV